MRTSKEHSRSLRESLRRQAEIQSNEEFDAENELLITEEIKEYEDTQNHKVTTVNVSNGYEEFVEETKEELPTAEEANEQEEIFQYEKESEGAVTEDKEEVIVPGGNGTIPMMFATKIKKKQVSNHGAYFGASLPRVASITSKMFPGEEFENMEKNLKK